MKRFWGLLIASKLRLCIAISIAFLVGVGAILLTLFTTPPPATLSPAVMRQAAFPLYFPKKMPTNVRFVEGTDSYSATDKVVIYRLDHAYDQIFVSVEAKPKGVVFSDFYNRFLQNKGDLSSSEGKAVVGTANGGIVGSLVTDKVWVVVRSTNTTERDTVAQIVSSLHPL